MTLRERKKLQRDFFEAADPNTAAFRALIDTIPDACFYMKDLNCRIMALNKRNCELKASWNSTSKCKEPESQH